MEKYSVIYANPPWMYTKLHNSSSGRNENNKTEQSLRRIPLDELIALPVSEICETDCTLFLWATTPILQDAFAVMQSWGFSYKTLLTWEKTDNTCRGYWFKTCTEHLIVAIKGEIKAFGNRSRNCYRSRKLRGNRKPDYFYRLIEFVTTGKRADLFGAVPRNGWDILDYDQSNPILQIRTFDQIEDDALTLPPCDQSKQTSD